MYFHDIVLTTVVCDKKHHNSDHVESNIEYQLTTTAFGNIPIGNINKIKLYANKVPHKIILKIEEDD